MRVNIITVYRSPNYGSYLQALSLYQILNGKYPTALVNSGARSLLESIIIPSVKGIIKGVLKGNLRYVKYNAKSLYLFVTLFSGVKECGPKCAKGCFIFGSDEIWNVSRDVMSAYPILWGKGIMSSHKMSYAPSVNDCDVETMQKNGMADELRKFCFLSARDSHSCECIQTITGMAVEKVLDPTMLIPKEVYEARAKTKIEEPYIAIYLSSPSESLVSVIRELSLKTGKKIVSAGRWFPWADEVIVCRNPFECYLSAEYVITNTFHGTAFSINLEKKFVVISPKHKIEELLNDYNLTDRLLSEADLSVESLSLLMEKELDYRPIRKIVDMQREASLNYLFNSLEEMCDKENEYFTSIPKSTQR